MSADPEVRVCFTRSLAGRFSYGNGSNISPTCESFLAPVNSLTNTFPYPTTVAYMLIAYCRTFLIAGKRKE
jgi:hypothetical protein